LIIVNKKEYSTDKQLLNSQCFWHDPDIVAPAMATALQQQNGKIIDT